jgi:hypothetical protein
MDRHKAEKRRGLNRDLQLYHEIHFIQQIRIPDIPSTMLKDYPNSRVLEPLAKSD